MKAHSERVPGKNFRVFGSKPLFRWVLDTLLSLEEISAVVINTDARSELRERGLEASARVLIRDRKPEICGDHVSMNRIIEDDIEAVPADIYLMTHTTNPLLSADSIVRAIRQFREDLAERSADSLFAVNRCQGRYYWGDGSAVNHDPEELVRTQDLEPLFEENSNLYLFTAASFAATRARIGEKPRMFETGPLESFDIDDEHGWRLAEIVASALDGE
jgi:CMP-N-acetylneuraminic acid synthetase